MKRLIRCVPLAWQSRKSFGFSPVSFRHRGEGIRGERSLSTSLPHAHTLAKREHPLPTLLGCRQLCRVPAPQLPSWVTLGRHFSSLDLGVLFSWRLQASKAAHSLPWTAQTSTKFCLTAPSLSASSSSCHSHLQGAGTSVSSTQREL